MTVSFIGVGSNVGDRSAACRSVVELLRNQAEVVLHAASSLYETSPVGGPPQRSYVNLVAKISTSLSARELLERCKSIEQKLGREPSDMRWGPRVADLDVLTFGDEKISEPDLEIPHPRLRNRRFVLVPLLEVEPEVADPWGTPYSDSLDEAEGEVQLLEPFADA